MLLRLLRLLRLCVLRAAIRILSLLVLLLRAAIVATPLLLAIARLTLTLLLRTWRLRVRHRRSHNRFGLRLRTEDAEDARDEAGATLRRNRCRSVLHWLRRNRSRLLLHTRCDRFVFGLGLTHRRRANWLHLGDCGHRDVEVRLGQCMRRKLAWCAALVARAGGFLAEFVLAQTRDLKVRGLHLGVGDDHDRRIVSLFDLDQRAALFVQQIVRDFRRCLHEDLSGAFLHRLFFGEAQDRQRQRFDAAHAAVAFATRADDLAGFAQARAQALARELEQAEARDAPDLHARAILLERVLQAVLDFTLVAIGLHVDEVDHHQAAEIAQAHLARDFFGSFEVGVERGFLDVAALGRARRVDVDRGQGFGLVDDD